MIHKRLNNHQKVTLGFTDLFIIGMTRNAGGSDFTTAGTQQTFNLLALNIGDVVDEQLLLEVPTLLTGGTVSAATGSVGVTGALTQFTAAVDVLAGNKYFVPANSVAPYPTVASGKSLTLDINTTAGNVSTLTTGEIWVWANISRLKERYTDRVV